ncbi:MAG TPA: DegT/DnrJ/EryC1/StrS family aminotransferase [Chloroflexota bacterium]|nr:DegT/DnrJ/EryC1/StrS family aminotransferase [Chloroflexota bacterium]
MSPIRIKSAQPIFADVEAVLTDLRDVLSSGRLMLGPYLERFEADFAAQAGTRCAVGLSSCTAALEIALRFVDVRSGEVLVPTSTFVATANAVLYAGGTPVLLDAAPETLCLDPENVAAAITSRTRAVIAVHLAGLLWPSLLELRELCARRGIALIEDCAHAHGATFDHQPAGSFGLAGCFSFYPTKIMTTAAGGMLTTNNRELAEFARSLRLHGRGSGNRGGLDDIVNLGNDWFMDEVRAVLGVHQLRSLRETLAHRRRLGKRYLDLLEGVPCVRAVIPHPGCEPAFYKFMVLFDTPDLAQTAQRQLLTRHGIETERLYWPPCHLQPVYRTMFGFTEGRLPDAEDALLRQLCLPLHNGLCEHDVEEVVDCLNEVLQRARAHA